MQLRKTMHHFIALLQQPYPLSTAFREKVTLAIGSGLFVAAFLLIFQPFGIHTIPTASKIPIIAGYGIITTACMLFNDLILQSLLAGHFSEDHWTISKQIGWSMFHIFVIALGNTLYSYLLGFIQLTPGGFAQFLLITLAVGIFPVAGITLTHYIRLLKTHAAQADALHLSHRKLPPTPDLLELVAENEKDRFRLPVNSLLFILSSDNYSTIFFQEGEKLKKDLIRSSLIRLEQQIRYEYIQRCHRSYIVNLCQVQTVSGNAQGYKLHFDMSVEPVPVSRKYSKAILKQLQKLSG